MAVFLCEPRGPTDFFAIPETFLQIPFLLAFQIDAGSIMTFKNARSFDAEM